MQLVGRPLPTLFASLIGETKVLLGCGVSLFCTNEVCAASEIPKAEGGGAGILSPPLDSCAAVVRASTMSLCNWLKTLWPFSV
jgi:hypothetical protein